HLLRKAAAQQDAVHFRHGDVKDAEVGRLLADHLQCGKTVGSLSDKFEIRLGLNNIAQTGQHDRMIVGKNHADFLAHAAALSDGSGMRTKIVVPVGADDSISNWPPRRDTRSIIPGSPRPRRRMADSSDVSKPAPSSSIVKRSCASTCSITTPTEVALPACLAMLVNASWTTRYKVVRTSSGSSSSCTSAA